MYYATYHDTMFIFCKQKERENTSRLEAELYECQQEKEVLQRTLTQDQEEHKVSFTCFSATQCMRL
jgi:hypothetical protein